MAIIGFIILNCISIYLIVCGTALLWWDALHEKFNALGLLIASVGITLICYTWGNIPFTLTLTIK